MMVHLEPREQPPGQASLERDLQRFETDLR